MTSTSVPPATVTTRRRATSALARGVTASAVAGIALLAMAGPAAAAVTPAAMASSFPSVTRINPADQQALLAEHNAARDAVGVPHLGWSDRLAADAQAWADHLGNDLGGKLQHSDTRDGENLHWTSDPNEAVEDAADGWIAERPNYAAATNKLDYDPRSNPEAKHFGHWTQIVWSSTTEVGCGTANGAYGSVTVCRYAPAGNRSGELPYPGADKPGTPTPPDTKKVDPAQCAYNPGGNGGYGSYVDGLALDVRDWEEEFTTAVNEYRQQHGVAPLTYSRDLARPAMWASLDDFNRGHGPTDGQHLDSRGMDVSTRVEYCSGYTGDVYELAYEAHDVASAKWQVAFEFWTTTSSAALLDPSFTTFSGVQMAYGNNDVDRNPAYYTLVLGKG